MLLCWKGHRSVRCCCVGKGLDRLHAAAEEDLDRLDAVAEEGLDRLDAVADESLDRPDAAAEEGLDRLDDVLERVSIGWMMCWRVFRSDGCCSAGKGL